MAQAPPVKTDVLRWAVDEDGRDAEALADALQVAPSLLDAWLSGTAKPTRGEVTRLSTVLQRPRALFFLPKAPTSAGLPATFRHPPGDEDREVGAAARRKVRQARRVQHAVTWARRDDEVIALPYASVEDNPEQAAALVRSWLQVTEDEQRSWKDDRAALAAWRGALQDRGLLVFVLQIGRNDVRGFSAWDDFAPLIVANSSGVNPAARSFTFAHELGHLVMRQDAACIEPTSGPRPNADLERWCEQFGGALLMPRAAARALAQERSIAPRGAGLEDVKAVMRRFRVSARAATLRLIDLGFASPKLYGDVSRAFRPKEPDKDAKFSNPPRPVLRVREYGPETVRTVVNALPTRDALSVLRVTVDDVRQIANEVPGMDL